MQWEGRRGSGNIEDRRTAGGGVLAVGGLGGVALLLLSMFLGVDLTPLAGGGAIQQGGGEITEADKREGEFVSVTLADTEEIWSDIFREELNATYRPAKLVLYKGVTQSACGSASGATGPFYCPGDKKVYLDTGFFTTLARQMGAKGDFAAAYVVAHEVAHQVQDELGILGQANAARARMSEAASNDISVRIELQADCFSGLWARRAGEKFGTITEEDVMEAINAAKQIGDDTLMRNAGRAVVPEAFTHGSSAQRQRWFAIGFKDGTIQSCDTFAADRL